MPAIDGRGRRRGVLADWNDERGFGFIVPSSGGPRVFAHISAFPRDRRPASGCEVSYVAVLDDRRRPRASQVRYLSSHPTARGRASGSGRAVALTAAALFFVGLALLVAADRLPGAVPAWYGACSALAFALFGADKSAARRGGRRTPESTLHAVDLVGGWPGALIARAVFRHKTVKQPFRAVFWTTVLANCAVLAWFALRIP